VDNGGFKKKKYWHVVMIDLKTLVWHIASLALALWSYNIR